MMTDVTKDWKRERFDALKAGDVIDKSKLEKQFGIGSHEPTELIKRARTYETNIKEVSRFRKFGVFK